MFQPKSLSKREIPEDDELDSDRLKKKGKFQSSLKPTSKSTSEATYLAPVSSEIPKREELLKLVEQEESGDALDENTLKRMILNFDKKVLKNQELRVKFPDAPEK